MVLIPSRVPDSALGAPKRTHLGQKSEKGEEGERLMRSLALRSHSGAARWHADRREGERLTRSLALRSVAAYVAHEINHPLGTVSNLASVLIRRISESVVRPSQLVADLDIIKAETKRAADVVKNLRVLAGGIFGHSEPVNVRALLHEAAERLKHRLPRGTVGVRVECSDRALTIRGAKELLHIALNNLLVNSTEAMLPARVLRPRITLRAKKTVEDWISIEVLDNGPGVPEALKSRVFEPFVSGKDGGSGLGLAIARDVIEWHHGSLELIDRAASKGACFRIMLAAGEQS